MPLASGLVADIADHLSEIAAGALVWYLVSNGGLFNAPTEGDSNELISACLATQHEFQSVKINNSNILRLVS